MFVFKLPLYRIIPVVTKISIYIQSFENIKEVEMSFSSKFNLVAEWFDKRLTWNDLNDDKFLNIPSQDVLDKLWYPSVIFTNTPQLNCLSLCHLL